MQLKDCTEKMKVNNFVELFYYYLYYYKICLTMVCWCNVLQPIQSSSIIMTLYHYIWDDLLECVCSPTLYLSLIYYEVIRCATALKFLSSTFLSTQLLVFPLVKCEISCGESTVTDCSCKHCQWIFLWEVSENSELV